MALTIKCQTGLLYHRHHVDLNICHDESNLDFQATKMYQRPFYDQIKMS